MFKDENFDGCAGEMITRRTALIHLAEIAMSLSRVNLEQIMNEVYHHVDAGYKAKREGEFKEEYHHNISANCDAERLINASKDYAFAVDAYTHLRMIDQKGENRELKLLDDVV